MPNNCLHPKSVASITLDDDKSFWKAVKLSVVKPHTINRILSGSEFIKIYRCVDTTSNVDGQWTDRFTSLLINVDRSKGATNLIENAFQKYHISFDEIKTHEFLKNDLEKNSSLFVILSEYFPRNLKLHQNSLELVLLDTIRNEAAFWNFKAEEHLGFDRAFIINLNESDKYVISASILNPTECEEYALRLTNQLKNVILPKIKKWMCNDNLITCNTSAYNTETISLINQQEYNRLYNELKVKYGEHMTKMWPEKTDPSKYVYEDVGIATYLLLLWKNERIEKNIPELQTFVDIGCGNGLLVYILSSEGHRGYGIDLRKRGIWDTYPSTTILETKTITPSDQSLFPEYDWLIGNHSDELSPWIPVMSALSSYQSRYFLLPCCAFEFNGKKYQRRSGKKSQYIDFLDYLQRINTVCGFDAQIDRLKIPSTKRICVIGKTRSYLPSDYEKQIQSIREFIRSESGTTRNATEWISNFTARPEVQKIQNCTLVDKDIRNFIITLVFDELIRKKRFLPEYQNPTWNAGGRIELNRLAEIIPRGKLVALKSECGGLQTLLRNNGHIFCVTNGCVELRLPINWTQRKIEYEQNAKTKRRPFSIKQLPCWFHQNHPDGCPLNINDCSYIH